MNNSKLIDDLEDILDKPLSKGKSPEEIRSHLIEENLSDSKKVVVLLKSSYEEQVIVGMKLVPQVLRQDKHYCFTNVFPIFKDVAFSGDYKTLNFYHVLSDCLEQMFALNLLTSKEFTVQFLERIVNKINLFCEKQTVDYESLSVYQIWLNLLVNVVQFLSESCIKTAIFDSIVLQKLHLVPRRKREYFCIILAKCAQKLNPQTVELKLYPILLDLCNDTHYEIRAYACQSLSSVCKALGLMSFKVVIPNMLKFLADESTIVKIACFEALVDSLEVFQNSTEMQRSLLVEISSFVEFGIGVKDESYLTSFSKNIGKIVHSLHGVMSTEAKSFFMSVFCQMSKEDIFCNIKRSMSESKFLWNKCKINLANCFKDMLAICDNVNFESKLAIVLSSFVKDNNEKVRETMCSKFIQIAHVLGPAKYRLIIHDFCYSLNDESYLVLSIVISQLSELLSLFVKKDSKGILLDGSSPMPSSQMTQKALLKLEHKISRSYKYSLHVEIIRSFELLPFILCTDDLIEAFLPLLEQLLHSRALTVRMAAANSMLVILRKIPCARIREKYYSKLCEFANHESCNKRIMFIEICKLVLKLYSRRFFKNRFYQPLIQLADDKVINVRIAFVSVMTELKKLWKLHHDKTRLDILENIIRKLLRDDDKDVVELAQKVVIQMDLIKNHVFDEEAESIDQNKENEENYLIEYETKRSKSFQKPNSALSVPAQTQDKTMPSNGRRFVRTLKTTGVPSLVAKQQNNSDKANALEGASLSKSMRDTYMMYAKRSSIANSEEEHLQLKNMLRRNTITMISNEKRSSNK